MATRFERGGEAWTCAGGAPSKAIAPLQPRVKQNAGSLTDASRFFPVITAPSITPLAMGNQPHSWGSYYEYPRSQWKRWQDPVPYMLQIGEWVFEGGGRVGASFPVAGEGISLAERATPRAQRSPNEEGAYETGTKRLRLTLLRPGTGAPLVRNVDAGRPVTAAAHGRNARTIHRLPGR